MGTTDAIQFGLLAVLAAFILALNSKLDLNKGITAVRMKAIKSSIEEMQEDREQIVNDLRVLKDAFNKAVKTDYSRRSDIARTVCPEDYADDEG